MHQGLIPVVSQESNIDTSDFGITLDTCSIEEIAEVVRDLSQRSPEWCQEMSRRTREVALKEYSVDSFLRNMREAIEYVLAKKLGRRM